MHIKNVLTRKCVNFDHKKAFANTQMTQNAKINTLFVNAPKMKLLLSISIFVH